MEWLGHCFHAAISRQKSGVLFDYLVHDQISHTFFADDLVIFSKIDLKNSGLLKNFLGNFCELYNHKVNSKRKTNVFFSTSVKENSRRDINNMLNDLGHYLRVPLFHQRVANNTLNFLIERVCNYISSWDAKKLFFVGCVTLAQTVMLFILSYLMQSTSVLKGICDSIGEITRQFIWGTFDGKRKIALVG